MSTITLDPLHCRSKLLPPDAIYTDIVLDCHGQPYNNAIANRDGVKYKWDLFGRRYINGEKGQKLCDPMYSNQGQLLYVDDGGSRRIASSPGSAPLCN